MSANPFAVEALISDLTEPQAKAVQHSDGPLLVLAGAGCGKTRVITRRAACLAATVTEARQVLAITFTNKAASEMRERLLVLGVGRQMTVCTFHALCAMLLRIHHERASLSRDFSIFDVADQRKVIKDAIAAAELSASNWSPARVLGVISKAKNAMMTSADFADAAQDWGQRTIARIYADYEALLAAQQGLDFDDLLLRMALLLRCDVELRRQLEARYTHVLIDEYQDTNLAQYEIARLLTAERQNLCATGDPDQSIYGWRGANIQNILRFEEDFPGAAVVRLEQNYRSTQQILDAASMLIEHNVARKDKRLWTENPDGPAVCVVRTADAEDEARHVVETVQAYFDGGGLPADVAIFYRINAMSRALEEALIRGGIAYQVARGTEFYNRKEIKDVLAYARVLINSRDEVALTRIINTPPRGIGKTTIERLVVAARSAGVPLSEQIRAAGRVSALKKAALTRVSAFCAILDKLEPALERSPRRALETILSESGMQADLSAMAEHDPEPMLNVSELLNAAATFEQERPDGSLRDWLEYTSLLGDVDAVDEGRGAVTLMTLHAAKGLEFPVVFMVGLEDGVLPFRRDNDDYDEEEERRLCFVGMTRAMRRLTLLHAEYRGVRGVAERKVRSQFLVELPEEAVAWSHTEEAVRGGRRRSGLAAMPADIEQWQVHGLVRHPEYDLGQITWMRPNGAQIRLGVKFQSGVEKTFVLPFARELERVDWDEVG